MSDYESSILQELSSIGQATGSAAPVDPVTGNEQIAAAPNPDDYEASIFKELSGLNPNAGAVPRTPQKQVDIPPDALSSLVISAQRGAGANRDFEKDLTTLDDADLVKIYGQGADALRSQMYNELKAQQKTLNVDRTTAQIMGDTVNKAAQGAISFIGGGLALSAGAGNYVGGKINDGLGIEDNATTDFADSVAPAISEATTAAVGWLNGFTSDQTQETDRLVALQTDYESGVNKAERDAAVAAGGNSTIETMKMVGKNFLDGGAEILDNPTATSNLIAGALGSLGPSAKVVGSVAKMVESTGTYKAAQLAAAIDNTGMGKILGMAADATKAGATAGAVGLTEAAGTYQQTLQEVLDMPEEDLMKSAEYFHLVENGMNPAQARTQVAERTAREAFFTALPLATATSIMALKFDANPLKAMGDAGFQDGLAGIGREVLGQTVEEALQSGSSEFSRNKAFQENIDPAQELFTGVGEQAAAGAIGGAGMAGVLGIPSAAGAVGNIAADNLSGPAAPSGPTPFGPNDPNSPSSLDPAMSAALLDKAQSDIAKMEGQVGPLTEYQQEMLRVLRSNQDNPDNLYQLYVPNDRSPAAEKAFNESLNDITPSALSTFVDTAKAKAGDAAAAAKDLYSKVSAGAAEGFAKAKEAVVEKANEINTKQTPEAAAETVQAAANSVVAVYDWNTQTGQDAPEGIKQATAPKAEDVPTELQSTLSSAPDVVSTVSSLVQNLTTGAIKVKDLSNDGLLYAHDHIEKLRAALPTMPKDVQDSVKAMLNSPSVAKIQARVKGLDLSTKVDNSVSAIKRMVRINPTKVDPTEVAKILEQRDRTDLTDEDVRLMKSAAKISSALDNHAGNKVQIGKDEIVDFTKPVNAPILDNQKARVSRNLQVEGFNGLRSINDYASDIFRAAQSGNPEGAVDANGNIYSGTAVAGEYGNFTQHLINKVEALNQSHDAGGKPTQYESLNAKSRKMVPAGQAGGAKSVFHVPGNAESIQTAQAIYNDAKAAVEVYNTLVETFPEMFPDGKKTLPVLKITPPTKAEAEPKPAQTEAKPKSEATAEGEAGQTKVTERKATAEEVAQIQGLLKTAYGDLKFPALPVVITDVIDGKEGRLGQMGHDGTMKLVPAVFENKDNMKKATHIVFHELGHWVDGYGEYPVSDSKDWTKAVAEFDAFVDNVANETQKRFLSYILNHRGKDTYASEIFADLFSIMGTRPDFVSKNFPLAQKLMVEALNEATGNTAKPNENQDQQPVSPDPTEDVLTPVKTPEVDVPTDTIMDDTTGLPVVFFHGTNKKFDQFNDGETFFTNEYSLAAEHALRDKTDRKNVRVIGTNLVMTNPLVLDAGENTPDAYYLQNTSSIKEQVTAGNHDGILIANNKNEALGIVFSSSQITQIEYNPKTKKQIFKAPAAQRNSLFTKVFTESKEPAPFTSVDDVIAQVNELGDHMGVFTDFLRANVDAVLKRLNARLSEIEYDAKGKDSVVEAFKKDPEKVLLYRDFKTLAFVDPLTGKYDPTIAALAVAFVLDDLSGAHPAAPSLLLDRMSEEGVSFDSITEQQLKDYMQSIPIRDIAERLGRDLPGILGLEINDDSRLGDAHGTLEGLVKEILVSIAETNDGGLLRIADVPTSKGITQAIVLSETMKNLQIEMGLDGRNGMSQVVFPENREGPSLNAPPEFVAQKQSRGGIETSTVEREVLKNMQSIAHSRTPVAGLLKALGPDVMFTLLGGKDVGHLADNHPLRRSIEGKNLSIIRDYQDAVEIAQAMEDAGPDSKVYYPVGISRVGRHQMQGPNPQNNKILRHSVTSTISVLDMRNNPTHQDYFWLTVAQAAGMAKAEKKNHQKILAETEGQFRSLYRDAIFLAREFLITGEIDAAAFDLAIRGINGIPENSIMPAGTKIVETEVTMAVIDAVMAVAALDEARADDKEDEFTTSLSFEIDGLTDGPGNMLVNMGQGLLTLEDYENLRRVGYFLGERNMTTNVYYGQQGNKDFYEMTTQYAEASMALDKSAAELMQALARFAAYFGDFKIEVGPDGRMAYKMTRNTAKSPVTKKGYGSGVGGIARGIAEDMVLEFYRFMTEDSNGNPAEELGYREFAEDFKMLFNDEFNPETPWDRSFFDKASVARFTTVVEETLGRILTEAAEKMLGSEIQKVNDTLVFMTNIQATYLQLAFEHRVRAILVARGADPKKPIRYQDLTVGEMRQIVSDLKALAPVYYNGVQALGLGAFEGAISENTEFSSTIDGRLRMKSTLPLPSDAGVKVIPYLNIGRGDAMMMNLTYGRENFPTRSIPIFDGVSLAIADIGAYSDLINEAVAENWNQDLLEPVLRDLIRFSQSVPADEQALLQKAYREVAKMQPKSIKFRSLENVAETLAGMVKANQARKAVFAKIPRSVNHMAGADRSINLGPEGFMDRDEINALIAEEMRNPTPKAEEEPADLKNQFSNLSVMTGMEMLRALLSTVKNPRLVEVLKTLVKANPNVRVITGNAAQIAAHRLNEGADPVLTTRKGSGFYDEKNQTIYLVSKNHETLVHELIHFTTFALVHKTYAGEGSPVQRDAVSRLEKLMGEFMEMDFSKASKAAQRAAKSAKAQILGHQANNDAWSQAAALNEFMAWSLANEALGRELGNTLADGVLRFVKTVKTLMARLLGAVSYDMFSNVLFNTRAILEPDLTQEPAAVDPKTNEPAPSASVEEALTGEVLVDEDAEGVIFGQGGMMVPYDGGDRDLIGGGNGSGGNGSDGSSQDPSGMPRYNNFWINLLRTKLNELRPAAVGRTAKTDQFVRYLGNARKSYDQMVQGGFIFTEEQRLTYEAIHMILALEVQLDARALQSMGKVFNHVVENLRPEMFTGEAQDKYQSFMDALGKTSNDEQISDAIATFFAMSQTNDEFRFVLEQLPKPADKKASSFSEFVSTMTVSLMRKAVGSINSNDKNALDAMDMLSRVILAQDTKEEFRILRLLMKSFDTADKYTSGKLRQISDLVSDYAYNVPDEQRMKKKIAESVALVTNLFSDQRADLTYEFVKTITHNGNTFDDFVFLRELVAEMIGTDKNNEKIVALMDVVKKQVSALREGHRESVPLTMQGNFKTKPTAEQWAVAHAVLAKTDFPALFDLQYADQSMSLISDPAYRTRQIKIYSDTIKRELSRSAALAVLDKAQQLADFMNGKGAGFQLLRNAFAINEIEGDKSKPGLVTAIDKLVSLLALDGKTSEELQTISDMYEADPDAMKSVLVYMKKLNQNEDEKLQVSETILTDEYGDEYDYDPVHRMRMNGYKGYVPNLGNPDVTITVEDDAYRTILEKRGFIRVGDYTADDMVSVASKGYYVSSTRQNGGYAQGVMQSIQNTYRGVNAGTGITVNGTTSGIIMGYESLDRVISAYNRAGMVADPKETLLPVYDGDSVIYYERALNPDLVEKYTQPAGNLALQLGVWSGRQVEEKAAQSYNALLIDQLKAVWDNREPGSDGLFIDIRGEYYAWIQWERATKEERRTMRKPDAIYADSWKVIPPQTKAYIAGVFGEDGFMVRRDQINTALGYAEPSIADFWTGKTRFSEGTASVVRAVADMTLGRLKSGTSALTLLQTAAGGLQETVSFAKDLIVTRSLVVPYLNSQANIFTLNLRGVPNKMIATGYRDKLIEIEQYNQNFKKIMFLNTQYDLAEGDANKQGIIRREIQVLKDQNKRMSIHPLVEAGAYKNISEGITEEDFEILKSGLAALVEKQVDRLPDIAKTIVRNGLVSQTTDIYRVANKAVQYGDFLAKGVYFDYLTKIQGMSEEDALSRINEEYVNFSTPPGRVRSALDKYGATWFMTYKIRIAKVAMAQARQNPVRALLVNTLDEGGRNTAQHSNLFANMLDGSIEYSLGWEMMMNSPGLNPWLNMLDW